MKTVHNVIGTILTEAEKWQLIEQHAEMLYCTRTYTTREEAFNKAVKKFCDYNEIAKIASLYDVVF